MGKRSTTAVAAAALLTMSSVARADDTGSGAGDTGGHRFGLVPLIGGGFAQVVHPGPLPGTIGFSDLGVEILGEVRPWGGFVRTEYLSSGDDGRWTAFAFSAGTEYRLFGNPRRSALFLRGGLAYERWSGNSAGCPIDIFVPNSCNLEGAQTPSFNVTADMIGVIAGARVEIPLRPVYIAFSGNFAPVVAVDATSPAGAFGLRFDIEIGFREIRRSDQRDKIQRRNTFRSKRGTGPPETDTPTAP